MVPEVPSRRLVLGGMLAAGAVTLGAGAPASATGTRRPTVVLVHGVFADASGWSAVTASLLDAGYQVTAPANPLRDLAGDSAYVSSVIGAITGPVILVGHSYGGEVITNAGLGHAHVKALVYAAAFAPDEGESALQLAGKFPGSRLESALLGRPYPVPGAEPGLDGYIDPAKFHDVFAQDLPRSTTRVMATAQRPGSIGGWEAPVACPPGRRCRPGTSSRPPTGSSRPPRSASWHSGPAAGPSRSRAPRTW